MRRAIHAWLSVSGLVVALAIGCQRSSDETAESPAASTAAPSSSAPQAGAQKAEEPVEKEHSSVDAPGAASPATVVRPLPPSDPLDATAVRAAVQRLKSWVDGEHGTLGAAVFDLGTGKFLAEVNSEKPINVASNQKILTAATALHRLGPGYQFTTELRGNVKSGRAERLVLRGDGDPMLGVDDLWRLARVAHESGLKKVGDIVVDQSHFDDQFVPPAFGQQPGEWAAFRAPVSAVSIERNTVTLNVVSTTAGEKTRVWYDPPGVVENRGSVRTGARGSGDKVRWNLTPNGGSTQHLVSEVGGALAEGLGRRRYSRRLDDPRLSPGYALRSVLQDLGIEVAGDVKLSTEPARQKGEDRIAVLYSEPLSQVLYPVGKESDNFVAETVLKALSTAGDGAVPRGSSEAGARAVMDWLGRADIDTKGIVVKNGSGLFDANRLSPRVLALALAAAYDEAAISSEFVAQLAVGGVDGTLRRRFRSLASTRAVRAKTGTLRSVNALSGFVLGQGGRRPVAFSLIVHGFDGKHGAARAAMDRVVESIAEELSTMPSSKKKAAK